MPSDYCRRLSICLCL